MSRIQEMFSTLRDELREAGGWRLGLVAAAALTFAVVLARSDWPFYRRMRERGVAADGWVTVKGLGAPDDVSYSFEVDGRTYSGVGKAGYGNKEFADLKAHDRVLVFYVPGRPDVHCLGDPLEHLRDQNRAMFFPMAGFALVLFFVVKSEFRRHGW